MVGQPKSAHGAFLRGRRRHRGEPLPWWSTHWFRPGRSIAYSKANPGFLPPSAICTDEVLWRGSA
jgi:hypothetical protein